MSFQIDSILPGFMTWRNPDQRFVLITLIGVDGRFSQPPGTQMIITEAGEVWGFFDYGKLTTELKLQVQELFKTPKNECIRYGKGAINTGNILRCGSGIDLHFNVDPDLSFVEQAKELDNKRQPFKVSTNLENGDMKLRVLNDGYAANAITGLDDHVFNCVYQPQLRLQIYGDSPVIDAFVKLSRVINFEIQVFSSDEETLKRINDAYQVLCNPIWKHDDSSSVIPDQWTAAVLLFHDHGIELPILKKLLKSKCFYIGAQGSMRTHETRVALLQSEGFTDEEITRLKGPMGLIPRTKSPTELAVSTFSEIMTYAQKANISC